MGRLARVSRDRRPGLDHRLEELTTEVALVGYRLAKELSAVIGELIVRRHEQELFLDPQGKCGLLPEIALPEVVGCPLEGQSSKTSLSGARREPGRAARRPQDRLLRRWTR